MSTTAVNAVSKLLEDGINAALAGNKVRARQLLMQVVTAEPANEVAWMWLAGVAETIEQTTHSLMTVLKLNPNNDRAKQGLRQTRMKAAQEALKRQDARSAWQWLSDAARDEPNNEEIWLAMASAGAAINSEAAVKCLQRVLEINPNNERAKSGLTWYQSMGGGSSAIPQAGPLPMPNDTAPMRGSNTVKIKIERTTPKAWACPICDLTDDQEQPICTGCGSMTTLRPPAAFARHRPGRPDVVSRAIEQLSSVPEGVATFETYLRLGVALMNQHRFGDAMAELQTALKLQPDHPELPRYIYSLRIYADADQAREREMRNRSAGQMIMVVDDSATVRKIVVMTLEKAGYRTIQAADGAEALLLLREHGIPALFLVDIMMPGMDGYALCKSLRQNPETSRTPIIMLSGKDGFFNKVRGRMAGASQYITKPFEPAELLNAIKSQIGSATNV
jgi:twitching motility two-component system response regulator PilG